MEYSKVKSFWYRLAVSWLAVALLAGPAGAQYRPPDRPTGERPSDKVPGILKEIGVEQKLDSQVPLQATFVDEKGETVTLKQYTDTGRPIVLNLVYYGCPMLCGQILNGITRSLKVLKSVPMVPGEHFEVVTISFDPRETPELAAEKKKTYLKEYDQPGAEKHWHWLTGDEKNIKAVTEAVGFRYAWDEKQQQYAHASAIFILTPDGRVSRYFFGTEYSPKDMRLGLTEASSGRIGGPIEKLMLLCYHYDATLGKYSPLVIRLIQIGGVLTLAALGTFMFIMLRRDRLSSRQGETSGEVS